MQWKLTRRQFGKIILPALPLIAMPRLALAAADKWMGMDVTKIKAINGLGVGSIKNQSGVELAAQTCQSYTANTSYSHSQEMHRYPARGYYGLIFDDGSSGSICTVSLLFQSNTGDLALLDYYAEVWLLDGSDGLDTLIGRSAKVDGVDSWADELGKITFSTPAAYDCTGTNQYAVIVKALNNNDAATTAGKSSATNFATTRYHATSNTMSHAVAKAEWDSTDNSITDKQTSQMPYMSIGTMQ